MTPRELVARRKYNREWHWRWYRNAPDAKMKIDRQKKQYIARYPDRYKYQQIKARSKTLGIPFILTQAEFSDWFLRQERKCHYCDLVDLAFGGKRNGSYLVVFSIDRKNPSLPYTIDNMLPCCWSCNRLKSDFFNYEEWFQIAQSFVKPKWQARVRAALGEAA